MKIYFFYTAHIPAYDILTSTKKGNANMNPLLATWITIIVSVALIFSTIMTPVYLGRILKEIRDLKGNLLFWIHKDLREIKSTVSDLTVAMTEGDEE